MAQIHIPRACDYLTVDFVKEFFGTFSLVERVDKSENGFVDEAQFHIKIKEWNPLLESSFQNGQARICYDDEGRRPSYFICNLL